MSGRNPPPETLIARNLSKPRLPPTRGGEGGSSSSTSQQQQQQQSIPPERREANRLAASRSRARQAERAGILEIMAKGLAEENRELKARVEVLVGMGLKVELPEGGLERMDVHEDGDHDELAEVSASGPSAEQRLPRDTSRGPASSLMPTPATIESPHQHSAQTLNTRLVNHYTTSVADLKSRLATLEGTSTRAVSLPIPTAPTIDPRISKAHPQTPALRQILLSLQSSITDSTAEVFEMRHELANLGGTVGAGYGAMIGGFGGAEIGDTVGVGGGAEGVERCLGDVRRRVGQLLTHYNPNFVDPSLPYLALSAQITQSALLQSAGIGGNPLTIPPKFTTVPLPQLSRKGRPTRHVMLEEDLSGKLMKSGSVGGKRERAKGSVIGQAKAGSKDVGGKGTKGKGRPKGSKNAPRMATKAALLEKAKEASIEVLPREELDDPTSRQTRGSGQKGKSRAEVDAELDEELVHMAGGLDREEEPPGAPAIVDIAQQPETVEVGLDHIHMTGEGAVENDFAELYAAQEQAGVSAAAAAAAAAEVSITADFASEGHVVAGPSTLPEGDDSDLTRSPQLAHAASPSPSTSMNRRTRSGGRITGTSSKRKAKPEPVRRYRIPGDDETIYVEQTISKPDGTEEVSTTTVPVHTIRPYTGQGKKRGPKSRNSIVSRGAAGGATEAMYQDTRQDPEEARAQLDGAEQYQYGDELPHEAQYMGQPGQESMARHFEEYPHRAEDGEFGIAAEYGHLDLTVPGLGEERHAGMTSG